MNNKEEQLTGECSIEVKVCVCVCVFKVCVHVYVYVDLTKYDLLPSY